MCDPIGPPCVQAFAFGCKDGDIHGGVVSAVAIAKAPWKRAYCVVIERVSGALFYSTTVNTDLITSRLFSGRGLKILQVCFRHLGACLAEGLG